MTKQVQRRRGTASQHTSFTGADGEISVNTTNKSVHVHDGVTTGGIEAARADLGNVSDASLNTALAGNTLSSLTITSADINGGTIDGTTIGSASPAAITGTALTATTSATLQHSASTKLATTATGIDVTGTVTADGLTVDGSIQVNATVPSLVLEETDTTDVNGQVAVVSGITHIRSINDAGNAVTNRLSVNNSNGDISFYEDLGVTPKFVWDASAESLSLSNATTGYTLDLDNSGTGEQKYLSLSAGTTVIGDLNRPNGTNDVELNANFGAIAFGTGTAGTATERLRITSTGSVGIGTSTPLAPLQVNKDSSAAYTGNWTGSDSFQAGATDGLFIQNPNASATHTSIIMAVSNSSIAATRISTIKEGTFNGALSFSTRNAADMNERMRITSTGLVGIGTSSPDAKIRIQNDNSTVPSLVIRDGGTPTTHMVDISSNATGTAMRIDSSGRLLVGLSSSGNAGTIEANGTIISRGQSINTFAYDQAGIDFNASTKEGRFFTTSSNGTGGFTSFYTGQAGGSEKMRIDASGNVGIGTSSPRSPLEVVGDIELSGGIFLGGRAAANYLDDYEEGLWTPTDGSGAGLSLTIHAASYTKIGRLCYIYAFIEYPSNASGLVQAVGGLPFNAKAGLTYAQLTVRVTSNTVSASNLTFQLTTGSDVGIIHMGAGAVTNGALSSNSILISGCYEVA